MAPIIGLLNEFVSSPKIGQLRRSGKDRFDLAESRFARARPESNALDLDHTGATGFSISEAHGNAGFWSTLE